MLALASCRDLSLPPPPGPLSPGTLTGRTVAALAGSPVREPLARASVEVLGTSLIAVSDADGYFSLAGLAARPSQVLFHADLDGDGHADRQRLMTFDALEVGLGKQVSLGDVLLSENAVVHGQVLRGDLPTPGGHAGTLVFMPSGPYTATSSDDGSFVLPELPEGILSLAFFRAGYEPRQVDGISLSSGQRFTLEPLTLAAQTTAVSPVEVSGRVLLADGTAAAGATVSLSGAPRSVTAGADGHYAFSAVTVGLYSVTAHREGALDARFLNVLVNGTALALPDLVLGPLGSGGAGGGGGSSGVGGGSSGVGGGSSGGGGGASGGGAGGGVATGGGTGTSDGGASLPGAPGTVTATLGATSIDVAWLPPAPSVPPVLSYLLRTVPDGGVVAVGAPPYPVALAGLVLGGTYTFGVAAVSDAGEGPETFSAPIDYVLPPSAPLTVTALGGSTVATVSWQAPASNGGRPLTAFVVTASPGGAQATVSGSATLATVSGLTNGTTYSFTVVAKNVVGDSPRSSASNTVVPQPGDTLTLTGGNTVPGLPNAYFPANVTFLLKDLTGTPKGDAGVSFTIDNGATVSPASFRTTASGVISISVRAGRAPGLSTLTANAPGLAPMTVTLTVNPLDAGTIFPITDADGLAGSPVTGLTGPAAFSTFVPQGVAGAPDGRLFVGTQLCQVLQIAPDGTSSILGGTGSCGPVTGGQLPLAATLGASRSLLFDGPRNRVYVKNLSSSGPIRIAALPLDGVTPVSLLVGGSIGAPTYGDGLQGLQATILSDGEMALSADGAFLYFVDANLSRIRRYEFTTGLITTALAPASSCSSAPVGTPLQLGGPALAADSTGRLLVVAQICGYGLQFYVASWQPGATTVKPLTGSLSAPSSGLQARDLSTAQNAQLTVDGADNVFITDGNSRLFRIDATTGLLSAIGGTGTTGVTGNYGPSSAASLEFPSSHGIFDAAGNLTIFGGTSVRSIVQVGRSQRTAVVLTRQAGDGQTIPLTGLLAPLQASLTVAGLPLSNTPVWWEPLTPGAGVTAPGVVRSSAGLSVTTPRMGQVLGTTTWRAGLQDFYGVDAGTLDYTTTGIVPDAGLVSTLVNVDQFSANPVTGVPGPGTLAQLSGLGGIAVADGGVLYLGLNGPPFDLLRLDASGVLRSIRLPGASLTGETSPIETSLALDEQRQRLYFTVNYTHIGMIDLTTGVEQIWAGGGSAPGPGYGDGSTATSAVLGNYPRLAIAPDGTLYELDNTIARIRTISPVGVITSWPAAQQPVPSLSSFSGTTCAASPIFYLINPETNPGNRNHFIQFDGAGNAYVSASYCGTNFTGVGNNGLVGGQPLAGILQISPGGAITEWFRLPSNTIHASGVTIDQTGALYWTENVGGANSNLWRVDPATRKPSLLVGTGPKGTGPDFQPGTSTAVTPGSIVPLPGGRIGWVENGRSVRILW